MVSLFIVSEDLFGYIKFLAFITIAMQPRNCPGADGKIK